MKKIGIFGGTFDPPHLGHTGLAEQAMHFCGLDMIIFVPAFNPPHKPDFPISPFKDRLEMLRLALKGRDSFEISDFEARMPDEPSYTFRTMEHFAETYPDAEISLILGSDSLLQLHTWFKAEELVEKWNIISYPRKGFRPDFGDLSKIWGEKTGERLYKSLLPLKFIDVSSTDLRKRISERCESSAFLDAAVEEYSATKKLYG